jgi:competence protein ComEA
MTRDQLNKATKEQLEAIIGIGPATAEKIVNYREEHGKYDSFEELKKVDGIKEAIIHRLQEEEF